MLLAGVFIVWRVVRGSDEIMSWAAVPFVLLLPTLSDAILTNYFDLTRAVAPIVPAAAFELARTKAARSPSSPTPPVTPAEATTRGPNDGS